MKKIKDYFETYPNSSECFVTTDGFIFHTAHDASAHANTLADKQVIQHQRSELDDVEEWQEPQEPIEPQEVIESQESQAVTETEEKPKKNKK